MVKPVHPAKMKKKNKQMDMLDYDSMLKSMQKTFKICMSNTIPLCKMANQHTATATWRLVRRLLNCYTGGIMCNETMKVKRYVCSS
jgi:hypothetical protein